MSDYNPMGPGGRAWQQQINVQRHIEKVRMSGATDLEENGVTAQQRRRFQRIELFKTIGALLGSLAVLAVILIILGLFIR